MVQLRGMIYNDMEMTLEEFNKKYRKPTNDWDFALFKILCVKCGSDRVEYNGKLKDVEYELYGGFSIQLAIVVKCHNCGNAFEIHKIESGSVYYCDHD